MGLTLQLFDAASLSRQRPDAASFFYALPAQRSVESRANTTSPGFPGRSRFGMTNSLDDVELLALFPEFLQIQAPTRISPALFPYSQVRDEPPPPRMYAPTRPPSKKHPLFFTPPAQHLPVS